MNFRQFLETYSEGAPLLRGLLHDYGNQNLRLIFADWAEEKGFHSLAGYMRGDTNTSRDNVIKELNSHGLMLSSNYSLLPEILATVRFKTKPRHVVLRPKHNGIEYREKSRLTDWKDLPATVDIENYVPALAFSFFEFTYRYFKNATDEAIVSLYYLDHYAGELGSWRARLFDAYHRREKVSFTWFQSLIYLMQKIDHMLKQLIQKSINKSVSKKVNPYIIPFISESLNSIHEVLALLVNGNDPWARLGSRFEDLRDALSKFEKVRDELNITIHKALS